MIIAIGGLRAAGKDETTRCLIEALHNNGIDYNKDIKTYRLSDPIKRMAAAFLNVDPIMFDDRSFKDTHRNLLLTIGNDWGRSIMGNDVWVNNVLESIKSNTEVKYHIISDVRLPIEYEVLKPDISIYVKRKFNLRYPQYDYLKDSDTYEVPKSLRKPSPRLYDQLTDETESYKPIDCIELINDGTLGQLETKLESIIKPYLNYD